MRCQLVAAELLWTGRGAGSAVADVSGDGVVFRLKYKELMNVRERLFCRLFHRQSNIQSEGGTTLRSVAHQLPGDSVTAQKTRTQNSLTIIFTFLLYVLCRTRVLTRVLWRITGCPLYKLICFLKKPFWIIRCCFCISGHTDMGETGVKWHSSYH
jgi:hypothetical protein